MAKLRKELVDMLAEQTGTPGEKAVAESLFGQEDIEPYVKGLMRRPRQDDIYLSPAESWAIMQWRAMKEQGQSAYGDAEVPVVDVPGSVPSGVELTADEIMKMRDPHELIGTRGESPFERRPGESSPGEIHYPVEVRQEINRPVAAPSPGSVPPIERKRRSEREKELMRQEYFQIPRRGYPFD